MERVLHRSRCCRIFISLPETLFEVHASVVRAEHGKLQCLRLFALVITGMSVSCHLFSIGVFWGRVAATGRATGWRGIPWAMKSRYFVEEAFLGMENSLGQRAVFCNHVHIAHERKML